MKEFVKEELLGMVDNVLYTCKNNKAFGIIKMVTN